MAFASACVPGRVAPSSSAVVTRVAPVSARKGRSFRPLRGQSRFADVYRVGTRVRRGGLVLIAAPIAPGRPEVGIVAGRKVGKAVRRNRAKRRLRAAMERIEMPENTAFIVIATADVADAAFGDVERWLNEALEAVRGAE